MPDHRSDIYCRGDFWLDHVRGAGRKPASTRLYIWWYDARSGRLERKSTRTSDVRLAKDRLDEHYLAHHNPTRADQDRYTVSECMTDYWIEHGSIQISQEAIRARLKLLTRYIDARADAGRLRDPFLPDHLDARFLDDFRKWALADPIVARRKDAAGNWIDGSKRQRSAATVEESVIALKASLNHAFEARRIRYVPPLHHKSRDEVTSERNYRLSIDGLAELLDYAMRGAGNYAGHANRLMPLRRYLVGAISTLGRPDAVMDMAVSPEREQWMAQARRFALNPAARIQTRKFRPIVPVVALLDAWLRDTDEWLVCSERMVNCDAPCEPVRVQTRVASVRSGWDSARDHLGIPGGWGPKLIRHSMSSLLANRRVNLVELEVALGHRVMKKSTRKYAHLDPDYLLTIALGIEDIVSELEKKAGSSLLPGSGI